MLVLSRKPEENFCFPNLGVNVRILSVKGRSVRIGIDAPEELAILRGELSSEADMAQPLVSGSKSHRWNNRLNVIKLSLVLAERHFKSGNYCEGESALFSAIRELANIEHSESRLPRPSGPTLSKRVLLVEDDPNELRLLAGLLELEGYDVITADDGNQAIHQLDKVESTPDFVLLDMLMPRRNGPDTIRWIRKQSSLQSLPVFSVSATSPEDLGVTIGPDGVTDWFPKPLDTLRLLSRLSGAPTTVV